jgi:hypothetical protein
MDWHLLPKYNFLVKKRGFGILRDQIYFPRYRGYFDLGFAVF